MHDYNSHKTVLGLSSDISDRQCADFLTGYARRIVIEALNQQDPPNSDKTSELL